MYNTWKPKPVTHNEYVRARYHVSKNITLERIWDSLSEKERDAEIAISLSSHNEKLFRLKFNYGVVEKSDAPVEFNDGMYSPGRLPADFFKNCYAFQYAFHNNKKAMPDEKKRENFEKSQYKIAKKIALQRIWDAMSAEEHETEIALTMLISTGDRRFERLAEQYKKVI